jgi:hypothetical protein
MGPHFCDDGLDFVGHPHDVLTAAFGHGNGDALFTVDPAAG